MTQISGSTARRAKLASALDDAMDRHGSVGAAAAWWDGRNLVTAASGRIKFDDPAGVSPTTMFALGSVTKLLTAFMVLQLVDDGLVSLADPITKFLPEFRYSEEGVADRVTVSQLLTHSGGTPDGFPYADSVAEVLAELAGQSPLCEPGYIASYSNIGYALLGHLLVRATGNSFVQNLEDRLLKPLHLNHTAAFTPAQRASYATPDHKVDPASGIIRIEDMWPRVGRGMEAAGSTLYSSAPDMAILAAAMLTGKNPNNPKAPRLLSESLAAEATKRHVETPGIGIIASAWGLGWLHPVRTPGRTIVGHGGGTSVVLYGDPDSGSVVAVATNFNEGEQVGTEIAREILGAPAAPPAPSNLPTDASKLSRWLGNWGTGPLASVIRAEGNGLVADVFGGTSELVEVTPTTFLVEISGLHVDLAFLPGNHPEKDWIHVAGRALPRV